MDGGDLRGSHKVREGVRQGRWMALGVQFPQFTHLPRSCFPPLVPCRVGVVPSVWENALRNPGQIFGGPAAYGGME